MSYGKSPQTDKLLDEERRRSIPEVLRRGLAVDVHEDRKFGDTTPYLNERSDERQTPKEDAPPHSKAPIYSTNPELRILPTGRTDGPSSRATPVRRRWTRRPRSLWRRRRSRLPTTRSRWSALPLAPRGSCPWSWTLMPGTSISPRSGRSQIATSTSTALPTTGGRRGEATAREADPWPTRSSSRRCGAGYGGRKGRAPTDLRSLPVEPVFSPIKQGRGLRLFLPKDLGTVPAEWKLGSLPLDLGKIQLEPVA
jgi:hypothetical protein